MCGNKTSQEEGPEFSCVSCVCVCVCPHFIFIHGVRKSCGVLQLCRGVRVKSRSAGFRSELGLGHVGYSVVIVTVRVKS